jgi:ligand-binding SRPBCC domain-containing protein
MINIERHSGIYTLEISQQLPVDIKTAWAFFSSPDNLATITPREMGFIQTSAKGQKMHTGQIITYKIGILPGIKTNWVTEITHVVEDSYFVDEQRFGPYAMWHHQHFFSESENGTEVTDRVSYKLPLGFLGYFAHAFFVRKQLQKIFAFRFEKLKEIFG